MVIEISVQAKIISENSRKRKNEECTFPVIRSASENDSKLKNRGSIQVNIMLNDRQANQWIRKCIKKC